MSNLGKRIKKYTVVTILLLIGLTGAGWGLLKLGRFALERSPWSELEIVQVTGVSRISKKEVADASGLKKGMNVVRLPLDVIARRVEKVDGIRKARVMWNLPHKVSIKVEERYPIASIYQGKLWFVDEDGILFSRRGYNEEVDLPLLTGELDLEKPGRRGLMRTVEVATLSSREFPFVYKNLSEISIESGKIGLRLKQGGAKVLAGDPGSPIVIAKLEEFLRQKGNDLPPNCRYVDLRYPATVITGI